MTFSCLLVFDVFIIVHNFYITFKSPIQVHFNSMSSWVHSSSSRSTSKQDLLQFTPCNLFPRMNFHCFHCFFRNLRFSLSSFLRIFITSYVCFTFVDVIQSGCCSVISQFILDLTHSSFFNILSLSLNTISFPTSIAVSLYLLRDVQIWSRFSFSQFFLNLLHPTVFPISL